MEIKYIAIFHGKRGFSFLIESPIEAPRDFNEYLKALGGSITVDGIKYIPKGFGWMLPATPVQKGEQIEIAI